MPIWVGGMAKKKALCITRAVCPMVMKAGKKVPAFAADGVGKMNMGGMAKKKNLIWQQQVTKEGWRR